MLLNGETRLNVVVEWAALLMHVRKVPGSKFDLDIGCSD
jgi:hypothetical protein